MSNNKKRASTTEQDKIYGSNILSEPAGDKPGERLPRAAKRKKVTLADNENSLIDKGNQKPSRHTPATNDEPNSTLKNTTRVKRQAWTSVAIASFFEGLTEHGKDFGRILQFMQTKHRKKQADPFIANLKRNQVRFFYYRTWHKVSSLLAAAERDQHSPSSSKKSSQPKKPKPCPGSDEETEGEVIEGEGVFDISLDEGEETHDKLPLSAVEEDSQSDTITFHSATSSACPSQSPCNPSSVEVEHDCYAVDTMTGGASSGSGPSGVCEGESEMCGSDMGVIKVGPEKKKETSGMVQANGGWHSLDLVAMICYSKLKQKYRGDKPLFGRRLYELVYRGSTTIRMKGKRKLQIKIPNCPAFKTNKGQTPTSSNNIIGVMEMSTNEFPSTELESTDTSTVILELRPLNSHTWAYVQQQSLNPRLRISVPITRTLNELFDFICTKWHLLTKDIFQTLKLYRFDTMTGDSCPHDATSSLQGPLVVTPLMTVRDLALMVNQIIGNKLSLQYEICQYESEQSQMLAQLLRMVDLLRACRPQSPSPSTLTSTQTAIPSANTNVTPTTKIAAKSTTLSADVTSSIDATLPIQTTPQPDSGSTELDTHRDVSMCYSCPSFRTSPVVREYMRSMPKRSPMKSPLIKYRKLQKQQISPLKISSSHPSPNARKTLLSQSKKAIKRTRLVFPDASEITSVNSSSLSVSSPPPLPPTIASSSGGQKTNSSSSITHISEVLIPPESLPLDTVGTTMQIGSDNLTDNIPSSSYQETFPAHSTSTILPSQPMIDLTGIKEQNIEQFSLAKLNSDKEKKTRDKSGKVHHLVTVSKKSLKLTGSFSHLRLGDLFKSVQDNLVDVGKTSQSSEDHPQSIEIVPNDNNSLDQQSHGNLDNVSSSKNVSALPKGTSSVLGTLVTPQTLQEAIKATSRTTTKSDKKGKQKMDQSANPLTSPVEGLPSANLLVSSSITESLTPSLQTSSLLVEPSPLQRLASQVASQPLSSQLHTTHANEINVKPFTVAMTTTSLSATATASPSFGIGQFKRPVNRRGHITTKTKPRQISQRPVVPKPLLYLPQMSQMAMNQDMMPPLTSPVVPQPALTSPMLSQTPMTSPVVLQSLPTGSTVVSTGNLPIITGSDILSTNDTLKRLTSTNVKNTTTPQILSNPSTSFSHPNLPPICLPNTPPITTLTTPTQNLTPQMVQGQLTTLLLNMLQQQLKVNQQQQQQQQQRLKVNQQQEQIQAILDSLTTSEQSSTTEKSLTKTVMSTTAKQSLSYSNKLTQPDTQSFHSQIQFSDSYMPTISSHSQIHSIPTLTDHSELNTSLTPSSPIESSFITQSNSQDPYTTSSILTHGTQTPIITSSDTVNELLRGLTNTDEHDSLQKLSEETVDVLPTFARAMMQMTGTDTSNTPTMQATAEISGTTDGHSMLASNDNSLMQLLQGDNSELGTAITDSNLKHIMENTDFSDMFSQLRDILKTPERSQGPRGSHDGSTSSGTDKVMTSPLKKDQEHSLFGMSDISNSPFKIKTTSDNQSRDTMRSLLEENSVDYINKFKELASAMSQTSQS